MSFKLRTTESVSRFPTSTRKTPSLHERCLRIRTNKPITYSLFQTALLAHGDVGQPNNDDVADKEVSPNDSPPQNFLILSCKVDLDWRAVRAKLVSMEQHGASSGLGESWAHEIAQPEKGCVLVCRRQGLGIFHQSVVFLLSHGEHRPQFKHRLIAVCRECEIVSRIDVELSIAFVTEASFDTWMGAWKIRFRTDLLWRTARDELPAHHSQS